MSKPTAKISSLLFSHTPSLLADSPDNYAIGGYHPAYIGEVFNDRYIALRKLFQGHYSSVWMAKDLKHEIFVSLKIYKASPCYNDIAIEELEVLRSIERKARLPQWKERIKKFKRGLFLPESIGPGEHFCARSAKKLPQLFSAQRAVWQPLLHGLRVPRCFP